MSDGWEHVMRLTNAEHIMDLRAVAAEEIEIEVRPHGSRANTVFRTTYEGLRDALTTLKRQPLSEGVPGDEG